MKSLTTLVAFAAIAIAAPAQADPRKDPTSDYSADAVAKIQGQPDSRSKIWYTKDKLRHEEMHEGSTVSLIIDRPAKKITTLMAKEKRYQQEALPAGVGDNPFATGTWTVAKMGDETVSGLATTKWQVNGKGSDGTDFKGFVWTTKENIQVKVESTVVEDGKTIKVSTMLENVKLGPVDAKVFEIPKDYQPITKD